jgi:acetyl-CoA C-acetyltransferase
MRVRGEKAYIVAARRSVFGRIGGVHRTRRLEDLAAPILAAALADAGLSASDVDEVIVGNVSQGGNPARLVALAAGLPDTVPATTIDRQCASGLDAILQAARAIATGEADVIIAGGAESLSTAPWRVARPRAVYQQPRFLGSFEDLGAGDMPAVQAHDQLAERSQISRKAQDAYAFAMRQKAVMAHEAQKFRSEIVALKMTLPETRDESLLSGYDEEELADLPPLSQVPGAPSMAVTAGNTALGHDAAAFAVLVSHAVWERLGKPPALQLVLGAAIGTDLEEQAAAPIQAVERLYSRMNGFPRERITAIELNEASAAQALAFRDSLGFSDTVLNRDGGALSRGSAAGAGSAALVVRLFTRLVRERGGAVAGVELPCGIAVSGALGGLGVAALFEGV